MGEPQNAIPSGWKKVKIGAARYGDKWWSEAKQAWLPVTGTGSILEVLAGQWVGGPNCPDVIRKENEKS